jgi:tRNA(Ile)-lysidine synthase
MGITTKIPEEPPYHFLRMDRISTIIGNEMLEKLLNILQQECHILADSSILIGVSGGPDSLCLLDLLIQAGYPLRVATFNHLLRPQSGQEVERVRQYCTDRQIELVTGQADVRQHARDLGLSIEAAARELRYAFLFQQAQQYAAHAVAVGHTADDQVETILMHLLRGTGPSGISGMNFRSLPNPWSTTIPIIRPLLSTWRKEIIQYIDEHQLSASQDQSNLDRRFLRNRLRHNLLPMLESYNPNIRKALWKTAQVLSDEQIVLNQVSESAWQECIGLQSTDAIQLNASHFTKQPAAIQRSLLRKAIGHLNPGLRDIDFEAIERARQFIQVPSQSFRMDLIAGIQLLYETGQIWLTRREANLPDQHWPQLAISTPRHLDIPSKWLISQEWELQASFRHLDEKTRQNALNNTDPFQIWLDLDPLELPLVLRTRLPGDRFQPLGMNGHSMRLSDFFINQKLPRRARDRWPLICVADEICWIPGFRGSHAFRLTDQTSRAVHLTMRLIP